jgi:hypothetical protein
MVPAIYLTTFFVYGCDFAKPVQRKQTSSETAVRNKTEKSHKLKKQLQEQVHETSKILNKKNEKVNKETPMQPQVQPELSEKSKAVKMTKLNSSTKAPEITVSGCLFDEKTGGVKKRIIKQPGPESIKVNKKSTSSIRIIHRFNHECCLKENITTSIKNFNITITEHLIKNEMIQEDVCNCICNSTIETIIELVPGTYSIVIELKEKNNKKIYPAKQITI